jgi:DNA-binding IclR family transcriptional regulator
MGFFFQQKTGNVFAMNSANENENRYTVPGLLRGLQILKVFTKREPVHHGADLARRLQIPRATVFRILQTLESEGYIEPAGARGAYRLGIAVLRLGFEYLGSLDVVDLGAPVIERLSIESGFTAHIVALDGRDAVFVAKAAHPDRVFGTVKLGTRLPAHATAVGQLLLGDHSREALHELYPERKLEQFSPSTPATVRALYERVQEVTERGYCISESFFEQGICSIAAPVRNNQGRITATISLTIPQQQLSDEQHSCGLVEMVIAAAGELETRLSYRPGNTFHAD